MTNLWTVVNYKELGFPNSFLFVHLNLNNGKILVEKGV